MGAKIGCENWVRKSSIAEMVAMLRRHVVVKSDNYPELKIFTMSHTCVLKRVWISSFRKILLNDSLVAPLGCYRFFFYEKLLWYMLSYFKFIILVLRISVSIKHLSYTFRHRKHMNDNVKQQDTFFFKWKITLSAA